MADAHEPRVWLARPGDAPAVAALFGEFRDWFGRDLPSDDAFRASVERLIADPATDYLLAAATPADPAGGVCQLRYRFSVWHTAEECLLEDLFVSRRDRRRRLGVALMEAAIERARLRGCRRLELDVNEANAPARALYASFGLSSWSDPPGGNNLLMRLPLEPSPAS